MCVCVSVRAFKCVLMYNDQYNRMYNLHSHTASGDVRNYENAARIKPESFKCIRSPDVLCALQSNFAYPLQVKAGSRL